MDKVTPGRSVNHVWAGSAFNNLERELSIMKRQKSRLLSNTTLCLAFGGMMMLSPASSNGIGGSQAGIGFGAAAMAACNPCNAACPNPCNPCCANPCAAANPCNPCAAANPCNPCAAANPCSPCNPCAAANPCNPCNPCAPK
jgi:hypothetical protein